MWKLTGGGIKGAREERLAKSMKRKEDRGASGSRTVAAVCHRGDFSTGN